jgi:RNA polymerase sigma-54 factor
MRGLAIASHSVMMALWHMGLDLRLQHKMVQQLVMTPQLQQAIKLLQLNHMEMAALLRDELEQNPVLEEEFESAESDLDDPSDPDPAVSDLDDVGDEKSDAEGDGIDWERYAEEHSDGFSRVAGERAVSSDQNPSWEQTLAGQVSLHDHLRWQVQMGSLEHDVASVVWRLIEDVDEDGYLPEGVLEEVAQELGLNLGQIEEGLAALQELDPTGVGARNLQECLKLQAQGRGVQDPLVYVILEKYMGWVEKNRLPALAKELGVHTDVLQRALKILQQLDPKPGRSVGGQEAQYVVPDMYVYKIGDAFAVLLNDEGVPKVHISPYYKALAEESVDDVSASYLQDKLRSAAWLLKSVHMRQKTLYKVMESILRFQRPFFENPDQPLRPLVLRDVAQDVGMHESTISRVTSNKYVHTPRGIFELKYFFNSSIACMDGDGIASESVRHHIQKLVTSEDRRSPLSDQKLAELLKKEGIDIARRTVAKYREMLKIAPSSQRRRAL